MEKEKKELEKLNAAYQEKLKPFDKTDLSEGQWKEFCELVHTLTEERRGVLNRFKQRWGTLQGTGKGDSSVVEDDPGRGKNNNNCSRKQQDRRDEVHHEDELENYCLSGRDHRIQEAKKLQMSYRRRPKQCVERILQGDRRREQCEVPMEKIEQYFSESYAATIRGPN